MKIDIIEELEDIRSAINNGFCFAGKHLSNFDDYREDFDDAYTHIDDLIQRLKTEVSPAESPSEFITNGDKKLAEMTRPN